MFNIPGYLDAHIQTIVRFYYRYEEREHVQQAADLLIDRFQSGNKLLICGNGGSAADAQHMAGELVPMGLPAIALTANSSTVTAISNDSAFDAMFSEQVKSYGVAGDVVMGLTTSGKSLNIREALSQARFQGLHTIALTGGAGIVGNSVSPDITVAVPSDNTQHIQEAHITILHIIWQLIKEAH